MNQSKEIARQFRNAYARMNGVQRTKFIDATQRNDAVAVLAAVREVLPYTTLTLHPVDGKVVSDRPIIET